MACYHPLKGFPYGETSSGRTNYVITSSRVDHIEIDGKGNIIKAFKRGVGPNSRLCISGSSAIEIPCGQCIGCRLDHSNEFATRCLLEMKEHKQNCFITLTYDEKHVPEFWHCRLCDHKENVSLGLVPDHMSQFMKALRNKVNLRPKDKWIKNSNGKITKYWRKGIDPEFTEIKFYGCGEYGDRNARPHFHIMLFGYMPDDLIPASDYNDKFVDISEQGYNYYVSPTLNKIWKKGAVLVTEASWETAAYTARYVMKKLKGFASEFYATNCIEPEFVRMSQGLGLKWFEDNKKCYATFLATYLRTERGSRKMCSIRYFDRKLDESYPIDLQKIKKNRKEFEEFRKKLKQQEVSIPYLDLLEIEEKLKEDQTRIFKRIEF